ncbi:high mobility group B protein 13-like [Mercurialis annua]|uniref:high mobility group B protein 13-like n=1 Tax=Mercurialis annua TaxID=3986 RepID=UPI0021610783|nr:high mobility group B protein 13-like [Mercurialis annua]
MAGTAIATPIKDDPVPGKKPRTKKVNPLKLKNSSTNEANIMAQKLSAISPVPAPPSAADDASKENHESLSQPRTSPKKSKSKAGGKAKQSKQTNDFEKEMQEMQEMLQRLNLEKEKTEELLKEKDEILKAKEEELETKGKEQEKLQMELKKLQKLKEFKPTMSFPLVQSLNEEQDKKKKKKDGNETKRPSTPYILWCKDHWNEVKKDNPNAEFKDISNIMGTKWKSVTAEEKKPYEEKYQADKEVYLQLTTKEKRESEAMKLLEDEQKQRTAMDLLEQYLQFKQETDKENKKKTKKEKDPLKPKQPMSAFFLFSNERRAGLLAENKNVTEAAKIAGEEWKNMSEKQKSPYEKMAKKNKEKYMQEMEAYKQTKDEEAMNLKKDEEEMLMLQKHEALQLLKKKEKTDNIIKKTKENKKKKQQNVDPNRPKKPASSFFLFSKEARKTLMEERPGMNNSHIVALISVKWRELGDEEREMWNAKAAEAMEGYKKEMEEYNKAAAAATSDDKA